MNANTPPRSNPTSPVKQIKYSPSIQTSPGKFFGSPKSKTGSPKSPRKYPGKFSPFRKNNKSKSPQIGSKNSLYNYFAKLPQKNLFKSDNTVNEIVIDSRNGSKSNCYHNSSKSALDSTTDGNVRDVVLDSSLETVVKQVDESSYSNLLNLNNDEFEEIINFPDSENLSQQTVLNETNKGENSNIQDNVSDSSFFYFNCLETTIKNALHYVDVAEEHYLFNESERKVLDRFINEVPRKAQYLYCRLFSRNFAWIREDSMNYPGISNNLNQELCTLNKEGFVTTDLMSEDLEIVLRILNVNELKSLCKIQNLPSAGKKDDMVQSIFKLKNQKLVGFTPNKDIFSIIKKTAVKTLKCCCAKLTDSPRNVFLKCMRLFTLAYNHEGKETLYKTILDRSSSKNLFPEYEFKPVKIFHSLENYIEYEEALELYDKIQLITNTKDKEMHDLLIHSREKFIKFIKCNDKMSFVKNMPDYLRNYTSGYIFARCLNYSVGSAFDKLTRKDAVEFYEDLLSQDIFLLSKRGKWYVELIKIFKQNKNYEKISEVFLRAQHDKNINSVSRNDLFAQLELVKKIKCIPEFLKDSLNNFEIETNLMDVELFEPVTVLAKTYTDCKPGAKRIYMEVSESCTEYCSVEEVALKHFKKNGYLYGLHDEGRLLKEVLLCCFWSVIYDTPVSLPENESIFFCWYQEGPADWGRRSFYERRKCDIEKRLNTMLEEGHDFIKMLISDCFKEYGLFKGIIGWNYINEKNLPMIMDLVNSLSVSFIVNLARHLIQNFREFSSGWPDLTLWNKEKAIFVEVKGPNDTLSNTQKIWLQNIKKFGGDATVCFVQDLSTGHTKRQLSKPSRKNNKELPISKAKRKRTEGTSDKDVNLTDADAKKTRTKRPNKKNKDLSSEQSKKSVSEGPSKKKKEVNNAKEN